ncbi:hypothetical protein KI387_005347 [Taxus chinensis]|uniref:Fe2OG dioxygenase domain-containing protein n=1 Tax=Taxus chinensis TaxID=29808 RepID=A0AA38GMN2_TAXCH|nr:hypothetical protein KI387_005347 [Taxus chinensis]
MPSSLQSTHEIDLPLIDISQFPQDFDEQEVNRLQYLPGLAKLSDACKEWGFFLLVNHGVPQELLQKVQTVSRDLLSMPAEVKDRVTGCNPIDSYYRSPNYESIRFINIANSDSAGEMSPKIWPQKESSYCCETLGTYAVCLSNLAQKIIKMILASLGLDVDSFYRADFEICSSVLRVNGYSSNEKSIGEEALLAHTDPVCLTILYQDDVGGLQIRSKEGNWFTVKPRSHSFVVNVGDCLKAWSNGRYRSAEHRVVYTGWKDRMSIGLFYVFPDDAQIWAPTELVDEENPRRYKPFINSQLKHEIRTNKEDKEKATALERFAGI